MDERIDLDGIRRRHARVQVFGPIWVDDGEPAHEDRAALLAEVDRLTEELFVLRNSEALDTVRADLAEAEVDRLAEALRSIAYEGGDCLALEAGAVALPTPSIDEDEDEDQACGVCAICWARQALEVRSDG